MRHVRGAMGLLCLVVSLTPAGAAPLSPSAEISAERAETMCRIAAQEQGDAGKALDGAVQACVAQDNPDFAFWEGCRQKARHRHLAGASRSDFVTYCMSRQQ